MKVWFCALALVFLTAGLSAATAGDPSGDYYDKNEQFEQPVENFSSCGNCDTCGCEPVPRCWIRAQETCQGGCSRMKFYVTLSTGLWYGPFYRRSEARHAMVDMADQGICIPARRPRN